MPLYARVDGVITEAGAFCLIELEINEPALGYQYAPEQAARFVQTIQARLALVPKSCLREDTPTDLPRAPIGAQSRQPPPAHHQSDPQPGKRRLIAHKISMLFGD